MLAMIGVIDQEVHATERRLRLVKELRNGRHVGEIAGNVDRTSPHRLDVMHHLVSPGFSRAEERGIRATNTDHTCRVTAEIGDCHLCTVSRERPCHNCPDAMVRSGDQRDLTLQSWIDHGWSPRPAEHGFNSSPDKGRHVR